jgi:hypothetical protein
LVFTPAGCPARGEIVGVGGVGAHGWGSWLVNGMW